MFANFFKKESKNKNVTLQGRGELQCIQEKDIESQIQMINLTAEDLNRINSMLPIVEENIDIIVREFYDTLLQQENLVEIIEKYSSVKTLKGTLRGHILEIFTAVVNKEYVLKRYKIAFIHAKIGLESKWYICAFQNLLTSLSHLINEKIEDKHLAYSIISSITKLLSIEQQIVLETYDEQIDKAKEEVRQKSITLGNKVTESANSLAVVAEETNASFQELNSYAHAVLKQTNDSNELAVLSTEKANNGMETILEHKEQIDEITGSVHKIQDDIEGLRQMLNDTAKIVGMVTRIADQTNLLSLNASIEAAHAGVHGKGFAVVAHEVRNLSEETKTSVSNISKLLNNTTNQMNVVTKRLNEIAGTVTKGTQTMVETDRQFREIMELSEKTAEQTTNIKKHVDQFVSILSETGMAFEQVTISADELAEESKKVFDEGSQLK